MTRKETEQLVRRSVRETIPERDALWEKIEAKLPDVQQIEPEKPRIVRKSVYRTAAAAACFVLVIGGVGLFAATRRGFKSDENFTLNQSQKVQTEFTADDAWFGDAQNEGEQAAEDAEEEIAEEFGQAGTAAADSAKGEMNGEAGSMAEAEPELAEEPSAVQDHVADASAAAGESSVLRCEAVNYGETFYIEDVQGLAGLVESCLGTDLYLQEASPDPETAGSEGLCVTLYYSGERTVYLTMTGDRNRVTEVRGTSPRVYHMPTEIEEFLYALMTD